MIKLYKKLKHVHEMHMDEHLGKTQNMLGKTQNMLGKTQNNSGKK